MAKPHSPAFRAKVIALVASGLSHREVGRRMGITRNSSIGITNRAKPPKEGPVSLQWPPEKHCLHITGQPGSQNYRFCGARSVPGQPYCAEHQALCRDQAPPAVKPPARQVRTKQSVQTMRGGISRTLLAE